MKSCNDLVSTAVSEMSEDSEHEQQSSMCQHSEDYLGQIIVYWLVAGKQKVAHIDWKTNN